MIRDIGEEIQQLLKISPAMTSTNISEQLGISRATCIICLNDLIDKKIVYSFKTKNGEKTYNNKKVNEEDLVLMEETAKGAVKE